MIRSNFQALFIKIHPNMREPKKKAKKVELQGI